MFFLPLIFHFLTCFLSFDYFFFIPFPPTVILGIYNCNCSFSVFLKITILIFDLLRYSINSYFTISRQCQHFMLFLAISVLEFPFFFKSVRSLPKSSILCFSPLDTLHTVALKSVPDVCVVPLLGFCSSFVLSAPG